MRATLTIWVVLKILIFEFKALSHGLLGEMVRLTSHGGLVKLDTSGLKADTINRYIDTSFDLNNITYTDEVSV